MMNRSQVFFKSNQSILVTVCSLLFLKTYFISRFNFGLPIQNMIEELILLLNSSLIPLLVYLCVSFFSRPEKVVRRGLISSFVFTFILYANVVYYRFFNDFITIPVLFQFKNFSDLGGSAVGLMHVWDLFLFLDFILLGCILKNKKQIHMFAKEKLSKRLILTVTVSFLFLNVVLAETQRPQLFTRIFDREMLVKYLGVYHYHLFDLFVHSKTSAQRAFAEGSDIIEIENYVNQQSEKPNQFTGIAKDKNIILISLESFQNFLINYKVEGQEVTPFLNRLAQSSYYFNNFYHQTGQGKTSDSEFIIDNSLYPLPRGAVFTTNAQNEYYALPEILEEQGYTSVVFHGNNKRFWNRDLMYQSLGYDDYFSESYYQVTEENSINYGLKDIPFFKQSIPIMKNVQQPFLAKFLTLTNHYPYILDEEDEMIPALKTGDGSVDRYVQTARYLDEALKIFFQKLKEAGLYENSIFILYGDHYGISENHNRAMSEVIGKEITPYQHVQLQKVPFIVHIPGQDGKVMDTVSGQIDIRPTILNLLGINPENDIQFGSDLFSQTRRELAILRDGSFITDDYVYTKEKCYQKPLGIQLDNELCQETKEKVKRELNLSDKVIQSDLLRFVEFDK